MILLMPKEVSFSWFTELIGDRYSIHAAYSAFTALNRTSTVIQAQEDQVVIEQPEVIIISPTDPRYSVLERYSLHRRSSGLSKFDDSLELEFSYLPDILGFLLG